jgi:hypothetical protein
VTSSGLLDLPVAQLAIVLDDPHEPGLALDPAQRHRQHTPALHVRRAEHLVEERVATELHLGDALESQRRLLLDQRVPQRPGLPLLEAAEGDAVGARQPHASEQRQTTPARERVQQQIEGDGVDLTGFQTVEQCAARLRRAQRAAQAVVLEDESAVRQQPVHHGPELLGLDRLLEIVGGAHAQRLHRTLDGRVRRDQDEVGFGVLAAHALEQLETRHPLHGQVGEHEVRRLALQRLQCGLPALAALEAYASLERILCQLPNQPAVVHDQYAGFGIRLDAHVPPTPLELYQRHQ